MKCTNCNKYIPDVSVTCPYCNINVSDMPKTQVVDFGEVNENNYQSKLDIKAYVKEPKNKKVIIGAICLSLFILLIFVLLVMSMFSNKKENKYKKFTDVVDTVYEYIDDNYLGSSNMHSGKYDLEIKVNDDQTKFVGRYAFDMKNRIVSLDGEMKDPREASGGVLLETNNLFFDLYLKNNNLYIDSSELFNEVLYLPIQDQTGLLKVKNYNLDALVDGVYDATIESLKVMSYKDEKTSITYLGKSTNVTKRSFVLDNEGKILFLTTFYNTLIDNSNFVNEYARIKEVKSDEIRRTLANYITNAEYKYGGNSDKETTVSVYFTFNKTVRLEINAKEDTKTKTTIDIGENKYYYDYEENNKNVYSGSIGISEKHINETIIKTYDITFDSDERVIDATLELTLDEKASLKKKEYDKFKNIQEFSDQDYTDLKNNLSIYVNENIVDELSKYFSKKCTTELKCACNDGEDTCTCEYNNSIIVCPRVDVESKPVEEAPIENVE